MATNPRGPQTETLHSKFIPAVQAALPSVRLRPRLRLRLRLRLRAFEFACKQNYIPPRSRAHSLTRRQRKL